MTRLQPSIRTNISTLIGSDMVAGGTIIIPSDNELGQIIRRDETQVTGQTGAPHEVWYRYSGRQLGYTGNNGTSQMAMAASISDRQVAAPTSQGTFRNHGPARPRCSGLTAAGGGWQCAATRAGVAQW